MDNKYLWKRKNRYWVRVRVPDKVRDIIGSVELCLNLYTSDLQEANVLKHGAVSKLKKRIESARKIKDNQGPETTKEELLKQYAQAIRDEYETGKIKKHEFTRPDKENDRARHIQLVGANTGPVFLTYKQEDSIDRFMEEFTQKTPYFTFTADDDVVHTLWQVSEENDVSRLSDLFHQVPALYIADGHHRSAAAARLKAAQGNGDAVFNYFLGVVFPDNQLNINVFYFFLYVLKTYVQALSHHLHL